MRWVRCTLRVRIKVASGLGGRQSSELSSCLLCSTGDLLFTRKWDGMRSRGQTQVSIRRFVRYEMGEGLEKRSDDLAAEVAKMSGSQN